MTPWIDRDTLIKQAKAFIKGYGYFLRTKASRISSLVEIAMYNSVVGYYGSLGFVTEARNLGPRSEFQYKLSPTGLIDNFSYFVASDATTSTVVKIFNNTKIQSAHDKHLYYTPDIAICTEDGAVTRKVEGSRHDSYISNHGLLTFVEVKHLVPFPEVLFSFTGLVQEFAPAFIAHKRQASISGEHLSPMIVFTGVPSVHSEKIRNSLISRYGVNVVFGTQRTEGRLVDFKSLLKYTIP